MEPRKMATRGKQSPPPQVGTPTVMPKQGIDLIERQIAAGQRFLNGVDGPTYQSWENVTGSYLEKALGANSPNATKFLSCGKYGSFPMNAGEAWWSQRRAGQVNGQLVLLSGFIELLRTEIELQEPAMLPSSSAQRAKSRKIFVVTGMMTRSSMPWPDSLNSLT
jgi:hypothetical protein